MESLTYLSHVENVWGVLRASSMNKERVHSN